MQQSLKWTFLDLIKNEALRVTGAGRLCAAFHWSAAGGAAVSWMEGFCAVVAVAVMFVSSLHRHCLLGHFSFPFEIILFGLMDCTHADPYLDSGLIWTQKDNKNCWFKDNLT